MRGRTRIARALLLSVLATPVGARGQSVRGTVVGSGTPVPGVMVILLDSASRTAGSALTDERGAFYVRAAGPGTFRLRTLRIGFRATNTAEFTLVAGQEVTR